ncbi:MAG: hypothetical protein J0M23_05015 [Rickettsiales bacterium]|nr:hypothetical protein [Rickettsiales bacterium]
MDISITVLLRGKNEKLSSYRSINGVVVEKLIKDNENIESQFKVQGVYTADYELQLLGDCFGYAREYIKNNKVNITILNIKGLDCTKVPLAYQYFMHEIKTAENVFFLTFSSSYFDNISFDILLGLLEYNKEIKVLSLSGCQIKNLSNSAFEKLISGSNFLTSIDLSETNLGNHQASTIKSCLTHNNIIVELDLTFNGINQEIKDDINKVLDQNMAHIHKLATFLLGKVFSDLEKLEIRPDWGKTFQFKEFGAFKVLQKVKTLFFYESLHNKGLSLEMSCKFYNKLDKFIHQNYLKLACISKMGKTSKLELLSQDIQENIFSFLDDLCITRFENTQLTDFTEEIKTDNMLLPIGEILPENTNCESNCITM